MASKAKPVPPVPETIFTPALAHAICFRMSEGESLRSICRDDTMPGKSTVMDWLVKASLEDAPAELTEFSKLYALAVELRAEALMEDTLEIADTPHLGVIETDKFDKDGKPITEVRRADMIEHRKLRVNQRNHMAEKLNPKKWGPATLLKHADPDGNPLPTAAPVVIFALPDNGRGGS